MLQCLRVCWLIGEIDLDITCNLLLEGAVLLNRDSFFDRYPIEESFKGSGLEWDTLQGIYDDYDGVKDDLKNEASLFLAELERDKGSRNLTIHSINCRVKDPFHLIEKIIRKTGREHSKKYQCISATNYREIVRDLVGIRILVLTKEEWEIVHDWLFSFIEANENVSLAEEPVTYVRYGDRDVFDGKIKKKVSHKGYRSQHYVLKYKGMFFEIQVRTLAEEVYGEFDHFVKYPYRENNPFLVRYTGMASNLLNSVDELISTCIQMKENGWEFVSQFYSMDEHIDAEHIEQLECDETTDDETSIDMKEYAMSVFYRKGR